MSIDFEDCIGREIGELWKRSYHNDIRCDKLFVMGRGRDWDGM